MQEEFITKNPFDELLKVSIDKAMDVNKLDFNVLSFNTTYSIQGSEAKELDEKGLVFFEDDKNFLQEGLNIEQNYKITVFEKKSDPLDSRIKLILNKDETVLIADINLNELEFYNTLPISLLQNIYKKMIKEGLIIGLRSFDFKQRLLDFLNAFKKKQRFKTKICISKGIKPISPMNEVLVRNYEIKARKNTSTIQKLSYIGVKQNELVLTHIRSGEGKTGKNLKLKSLAFRPAKETKLEFSCSDNFEKKELSANASFIKTEFFAKKNGFILKELGGSFDIQNELNLNAVNFKEVGTIACGLDTGVSINIRNASELEEAVGSGVNIECETLTINGTVAGNTLLKAKNFKLYGTSNPKTKIIAQNAYIAMHKGILECENADIDNLENGSVQAKIVKIKKSLGATIKARYVQILNLVSNNQITFNSICFLEQCSGSNNKFLAHAFKDDEELEKKLEQLELRQKELPRLIVDLEQSVKNGKAGVNMLLKKINELKANNLTVPSNFSSVIKDYQNASEELSKLYQEQSENELLKQQISKQLIDDEEELFKAKLINKNGLWSEMNEIRFRLLYPKKELLYSSKADDTNKTFFIQKNYDNNKEVRLEMGYDFNEKDIQCFTPSKA